MAFRRRGCMCIHEGMNRNQGGARRRVGEMRESGRFLTKKKIIDIYYLSVLLRKEKSGEEEMRVQRN